MLRAWIAAACLLVASACLSAFAQDADEEREPQRPTGPVTRVIEVVHAIDGAPAADVEVEAWGPADASLGRDPWDKMLQSVQRTDVEGITRFVGVSRRDVVFVARKAEHSCAWHEPGRWYWSTPEEDDDPDGDGVTHIRLALVRGSMVEGRVVGVDGEPVAGAEVVAYERAGATDMWTLDGVPLWTARTGPDGAFRTWASWPAPAAGSAVADGVASLVHAQITARAPGHIRESLEISRDDAGAQTALAFQLRPAGQIGGVVTDAAGGPVPGAQVQFLPSDHHAWRPDNRQVRDTRETHPREDVEIADADGRYVFTEAALGERYFIYAEQFVWETDEDGLGEDQFGDGRVVARSVVTPAVGIDRVDGRASCDLRVVRTARLVVHVVDPDGDVVEDPYVQCTPPPGARAWASAHEEDGTVTVDDADAGTWTLEVHREGLLARRVEIEVVSGVDQETELKLTGGVAVEGIVVDDAGQGVPHAKVSGTHARLGGDELSSQSTTADASGRFRLTGLPPGPVELWPGSAALRSDSSTRVTAPATDVRLVLHAVAKLRIRLQHPDADTSLPETVRITITLREGPNAGNQIQDLATLTDGAYVVADLMPGKVTVAVEARGAAPFVKNIEIAPGVVNEPPPFVLDAGVSLTGRIVDLAGDPVADARVLPWGNPETAATSGPDGKFELQHLGRGFVELVVQADGRAEIFVGVVIREQKGPLEIVLPRGGLVRGRVLDRNGEPASHGGFDFLLADEATDNVSRWRAIAADGTFAIRLPAGRYRCDLSRTADPDERCIVDVVEGGEVVLELVRR